MSKYMPCKDANLQANNGVALAIPVPTFMIFLTPYKMCKSGILTEKDSPPLSPPAEVVKTSSLLGRIIPTIPNITDVPGEDEVQPGASPESASKSSMDRCCWKIVGVPERAAECIVKRAVTRIPSRPFPRIYVSAVKGPNEPCRLPIYRGENVGKYNKKKPHNRKM